MWLPKVVVGQFGVPVQDAPWTVLSRHVGSLQRPIKCADLTQAQTWQYMGTSMKLSIVL